MPEKIQAARTALLSEYGDIFGSAVFETSPALKFLFCALWCGGHGTIAVPGDHTELVHGKARLLLRKYEIHGALRTAYRTDGKRYDAGATIDYCDYLVFACLLVLIYRTTLDPRYLNTALKVLDRLPKLDTPPSPAGQRLVQSLTNTTDAILAAL